MKKKLIRYIYIPFVSLLGCVTPVEDYEPESTQQILVVEGFIDNDFGPHEIEISFISPFAGIQEGGAKRVIDNADVTLIDDLGNYIQLEAQTLVEDELFNADPMGCTPGIAPRTANTNYFTPADFRGVVGRSYFLEIVLINGITYRSTLQTLQEPVPIEDVSLQFISFPSSNDLINTTGIEVFATYQDPAESENFYLWQIDGIYKIETPAADPPACCLYDPRDNLGTECWVTELDVNTTIFASDDSGFDGTVTTQKVGFIEDDGNRFTSTEVPSDKQYYVTVKQYAISASAYDFYSNLEVLSEINGEIFDPPPVAVPTNVFNINDPTERVIGVFGVHAKTTFGAFVNRNQLLEIKDNNLCGDCRFSLNGELEIPDVYR